VTKKSNIKNGKKRKNLQVSNGGGAASNQVRRRKSGKTGGGQKNIVDWTKPGNMGRSGETPGDRWGQHGN